MASPTCLDGSLLAYGGTTENEAASKPWLGAMRLRVQSDPRLTDLYGQETPSAASKHIKISV